MFGFGGATWGTATSFPDGKHHLVCRSGAGSYWSENKVPYTVFEMARAHIETLLHSEGEPSIRGRSVRLSPSRRQYI
jgi:hypothetical protein